MALCDECSEELKQREELAEKYASEGKTEELRALYNNPHIEHAAEMDTLTANNLTVGRMELSFKILMHRACVNCKQDLTAEEYDRNKEGIFHAKLQALARQNAFIRKMFPSYDRMFPKDMSKQPICKICNKPEHQITEIHDHKFILCAEIPKNEMAFTDNYQCGCCRCAEGRYCGLLNIDFEGHLCK